MFFLCRRLGICFIAASEKPHKKRCEHGAVPVRCLADHPEAAVHGPGDRRIGGDLMKATIASISFLSNWRTMLVHFFLLPLANMLLLVTIQQEFSDASFWNTAAASILMSGALVAISAYPPALRVVGWFFPFAHTLGQLHGADLPVWYDTLLSLVWLALALALYKSRVAKVRAQAKFSTL